MDWYNILTKGIAAIIGVIAAYLQPTFPFILVCTLAVCYDCYTAYRLSKRVKKAHPDKAVGKFQSSYARRIFDTLINIYALILLAYLIDNLILTFSCMYLANIVAGAFCFIQVWSILENESSCNGNKWAKIAQKVLVDKTERHFDLNLKDFKEDKDDTKDK